MQTDIQLKSYKYQLRLNKSQRVIVDRWISGTRYIYNIALQTKVWAWEGARVSLSCYDLQKQLTEVRSVFDWVNEIPRDVCNMVLERLDAAYKSFFTNIKNKVKTEVRYAGRLRWNSINFKSCKYAGGMIFQLPKLGKVRIENDLVPDGAECRTCTISRKDGKYYLSVAFKMPIEQLPKTGKSIGIDVGLAYFSADSDGNTFNLPYDLKRHEARLRILNRAIARRKKGSIRRNEALRQRRKLYDKISQQRNHFLHEITNYYVSNYDLICVENLKVKNMVKNKNLSKSILNSCWSNFRRILEYKAKWYGKKIVAVMPHFTSQMCNLCGHTEADNRKSQSVFLCLNCGHSENADINAAKNILKAAGV